MKFIGSGLRRWEKAKWGGEFLGSDKKQNGQTHTSFTLVDIGQLTFTNYK